MRSRVGVLADRFDIGWLSSLELAGNQLRGRIPQSLARASGLQMLDLSHNQLHGELPCFPNGTLSLKLAGNAFHGAIPACLCKALVCSLLMLPGRVPWQHVFC